MTSSGEMRNRIDSVLTKLAGSRERFIRGGAESCGGYQSNGLQDPKEWRDPEFVARFLNNFENRTIPSQRLVSGGSSASRIESILSKLAGENLRYVRGGAKGKPTSKSSATKTKPKRPASGSKKAATRKPEPKPKKEDPNYGKKGAEMSEEDLVELAKEAAKKEEKMRERMQRMSQDTLKYLNLLSKKRGNSRPLPNPTFDRNTGKLHLKYDSTSEYNRLINLIDLNRVLIEKGTIEGIIYDKEDVAKKLIHVTKLFHEALNDTTDRRYDFTRKSGNRKEMIKEFKRLKNAYEGLLETFDDSDPLKKNLSNALKQHVEIPLLQQEGMERLGIRPIKQRKAWEWDKVFKVKEKVEKQVENGQDDEETAEAKEGVIVIAEQAMESLENQPEAPAAVTQLLTKTAEADNVDDVNDALDNFDLNLPALLQTQENQPITDVGTYNADDDPANMPQADDDLTYMPQADDDLANMPQADTTNVNMPQDDTTTMHQVIYENAVEKAAEAAEQARSDGLPEEEVQAEALEAAEQEASDTYNEDIPEDKKENISVADLVEIARIATEDALRVKQANATEGVKEAKKNEIMKALKAIAGEVARESIQDGSDTDTAAEKAKEAAIEALRYGDSMAYVDFPEMMSAVNDAMREIRDETQPSTSTQSSTPQEPIRPEMLDYMNDLDDNFFGEQYGDSGDEMQGDLVSDSDDEQEDFIPSNEAVKITDDLQKKIKIGMNAARRAELELEADDASSSDREEPADESGYETPDEEPTDDDEPGKDIGVGLKKKGIAKLLSAILGDDFDDDGSVGYAPQQRGSKSTVGYAPKPKVTGQKSKVDRALDKYLREGKEPRDNYSRLAANLDNELRVKSGLKPKKDEDRPTHNVRKSTKKKKPVEEEEEEKPKQVKKKASSGSKTVAKKKPVKKAPVKKTTKRKPKTNPVDIEAERDKLETKLYEEEAVKEQKVQKSRRGPLKGKPLPTAKGGKMIIEETVRSTPMMSKIEVVAKTRPMTAWNAHVAATSKKHKGKPFPEIIKIAKKTYKK